MALWDILPPRQTLRMGVDYRRTLDVAEPLDSAIAAGIDG